MLAALLATMALAETQDVTFRHQPSGSPSAVTVVGRFNGWDISRDRLARGEDGVWTVRLKIEPGVYEYWFLEDFRTKVADPERPDQGQPGQSRLVVPPAAFAEAPAGRGEGRVTAAGLRHRPGPLDRIRWNSSTWVFRLRTRADDVEGAVVKAFGRDWPMTKTGTDGLFETWQGRAAGPGAIVPYTFEVWDGETRVVVDADGSPFVAKAEDHPLVVPPKWLAGAVFYQVFPDRFANGDPGNDPDPVEPWGSTANLKGFYGGDIAGLSQRLAHLRDLGVTGLLLNPVFPSPTYHRYNPTEFGTIDPRLGSDQDFDDLVLRLRALGIKVVLDGVFNHTSPEFFAFRDLREKGADSAYRDWYTVLEFPLRVETGQQTYKAWFGHAGLPVLRTDNPTVQAFLDDVAAGWVRDRGVAGWRLDAADEVDPSLWRSMRRAVKAASPEAWLLGEVWGDAHPWLQGDQWDSAMNYPWRGAVLDFFVSRSIGAAEFDRRLEQIRETIPEAVTPAMLNLLGSHDTPRLRTLAGGDDDRVRQALLFQFTYPGVPVVYYGDEVGMEGGGDPDCRRCMDWIGAGWDKGLLQFARDLVALRKGRSALREGSYQTARVDEAAGTFAFLRRTGSEVAVVAFNRGSRPATWEFPMRSGGVEALLAHKGQGRVSNDPGKAGVAAGERVRLELRPGGCAVVVFRPQIGRDVLESLAGRPAEPPKKDGPRRHPIDP